MSVQHAFPATATWAIELGGLYELGDVEASQVHVCFTEPLSVPAVLGNPFHSTSERLMPCFLHLISTASTCGMLLGHHEHLL